MLLGVLVLVTATRSGRIDEISDAAERGQIGQATLLAAVLLLLAGAAAKSAQVPLQGWLPDAMVGPTPVSALLHSATMVAAGVFLVARLYPLFVAAPPALEIAAWLGVVTAVLGGLAALVETDLKRTLAYSTMSQLGLMFLGLGAGSLLAGLLLLVAQALYKALLFLAAGAIEHVVGGRDLDRMGGLALRMPWTSAVFALGAISLAGLPVTLALPPKDPALAATWEASRPLFLVALLATIVTALYSARLLGLVVLGAPSRASGAAHEAPAGLLVPILVLAGLVPLGLLANASLLGRPLARFLGTETPEVDGVTAMALGTAALGFVLGLAGRYRWRRAVVWPPLSQAAPIFADEFGLKAVYQTLARGALAINGSAGSLDRRVFDPLARLAAAGLLAAARRALDVDHLIFDRAATRAARAMLTAARCAQDFDRSVFDRAATQAATATLATIRAIWRFDLTRVDRAVAAFAEAVLSVGQGMRRLQTGRVENYLMPAFLWGLGLIAAAALAAVTR